jgi:hypothetical protein
MEAKIEAHYGYLKLPRILPPKDATELPSDTMLPPANNSVGAVVTLATAAAAPKTLTRFSPPVSMLQIRKDSIIE